ncbi:MAG: glucose-1-phosphate adenylyltransferase [Deltaproteobacteria bacterium]|nr:glucose-1-phosphate adenylyltransferase [Deltaproteobacteria bacterium]
MSLQAKNILTFILAGGKGSRLYPLTRDRSKPAVPFAARFRIIDYVLSNCINSGLRQIYVLTQTKSLSLESHLKIGWNFLAHELSEFISSVPAQQRISDKWYQGTADAIFQNLHLLEDHRPDHVLILSGDHIYNMDYSEIFAQHTSQDADLTLSVLKIKKQEAYQFGVLTADQDQNITSFLEKPSDPSLIPGEGDDCFINMGIYLFKTDSLVKSLAQDARNKSSHDFGKDIIPSMLGIDKVKAYSFVDSRFGYYWQDVGTIRSYFDANMIFLDQLEKQRTCTPEWKIRTMGEQLPSAHYGGSKGVEIFKSSIGSGSKLFDCKISRSLIGRNVCINSGCHIENSIIMSDCVIEENCHIKNAIIDTNVVIPANQNVGIKLSNDKQLFFISDGLVVVPKNFRY